MTDKIKISAPLRDAQTYLAECLVFYQDEPFVLDCNDSVGYRVQAVSVDHDQICAEVELGPDMVAKLVKLGVGLPHQTATGSPKLLA